jgi:hypothetical protein
LYPMGLLLGSSNYLFWLPALEITTPAEMQESLVPSVRNYPVARQIDDHRINVRMRGAPAHGMELDP